MCCQIELNRRGAARDVGMQSFREGVNNAATLGVQWRALLPAEGVSCLRLFQVIGRHDELSGRRIVDTSSTPLKA